MTTPDEILDFWFGPRPLTASGIDARFDSWFSADPDFDSAIRSRFGSLPELARAGSLDGWLDDPRSTVALVIVLDQFPRNLYREDRRAFGFDDRALEVALAWIEAGRDREVAPIEAVFGYLPLEHAEDPGQQERCVALYTALAARVPPADRERFEGFVGYADRHRVLIDRFGRFPHRNEVLGRRTTPEETAYLEAGGDTFGG